MERKRLPPGILSIQFIVLMSYSSIAVLTLLPLYLKFLGGEPREIGFYVSLFSFAALFSRPFGGWLLSRGHPKKILVAGLLLLLGATIAYLFVKKLDWGLGLIRLIHGAGFSFFILSALLIAILKSRENETAYAIGVVSTGFMLPLLVIPFLGERVIEKFGYFFFFITAIVLAAIPIVYVLLTKITIPRFSEHDERKGLSYFHLLGEKKIALILALTFIFELGLSSSLNFVPLLAHMDTPMRAGFFYTFLGMSAVFLRLYGGRKFKFWGSSKMLFPAFFFLFCGGFLTSLSSNNVVLSFSGVVWGLGTGILYPHLSALSVERVRPEDKGKVLSLFASAVDLGFALGPLSFGLLSQFYGLRKSFALFAIFIFVACSALVIALERVNKLRSRNSR